MLGLRFVFKLILEYIKRFKLLIILGLFFGLFSFLVIRYLAPYFIFGTTEKIGVTGRFRVDTLPNLILDQIGAGLTKINDDGTVSPNIALSWETPDKGTTWIFHLKDGLTWQDGTPLKAKDIVYKFSDLSIETPDDKTIIFKLKSPFSPFPFAVSKPTFKTGLLGLGEWKVNKLSLAGNYIYTLELSRKSGQDKKIYKFYPTEERAKLAFKMGEVDTLINLIDPDPFDHWNTVSVESKVNRAQIASIFLNTQNNLLSEKTFRQALNYATKKDYENRALSPISVTSWAYNPEVKPYDYDLEYAKKLLNGLDKKFFENPELKLTTSPDLLGVAEKVAENWRELGVKTTVQVISGIPQEYDALLGILDVPHDPDQYPLWHSTQTQTNISRYKNPRIDKLLEDGRSELSLEARKKIYLDLQRFLIEDSPAIFLYYPKSYKIDRK